MRDDRLFSRIALFWNVIMAALLVLSSAQAVTDRPHMLHSWDGIVTGALVVAYGAWFYVLMTLRVSRGRAETSRPSRARRSVLLGVGFALTVGLVVLHAEYVGLVFAGMGIAVFALDGWVSLVPVSLLGALFLYSTGTLRSGGLAEIGSGLLGVVATAGLIYSLAIVIRQRVERDRLLVELQEAHHELRLSSARDVELAALRERNRLAREMHDSLGHALVLIAIKIEAAQRLEAVDPLRAAAEWEATKALVRSTMADLRSSLAGLRLPVLDEQPLSSALADLAADVQGSAGPVVESEISGAVDGLDRSVQEALYRLAQEGVSNVVKHARARHAWLHLALRDDTAELVIEDDGIGLHASAGPGEHFGVVGMRERVEGLGGSFALGPRPGGGVRLRAILPVREGADVRHPRPVG